MKYFFHLGHEHHAAKREQQEREQRAIDEARLAAFACPVVEEDAE